MEKLIHWGCDITQIKTACENGPYKVKYLAETITWLVWSRDVLDILSVGGDKAASVSAAAADLSSVWVSARFAAI